VNQSTNPRESIRSKCKTVDCEGRRDRVPERTTLPPSAESVIDPKQVDALCGAWLLPRVLRSIEDAVGSHGCDWLETSICMIRLHAFQLPPLSWLLNLWRRNTEGTVNELCHSLMTSHTQHHTSCRNTEGTVNVNQRARLAVPILLALKKLG
jgi:hypothetical protein